MFTQLRDQTFLFLTIQFSISHLFALSLNVQHFYLTLDSSPGLSEPGSNGNEGVLRIPQNSSITEASPSDCLVSYLGHLLGVLLLSRDAAGVFYRPNWLGQPRWGSLNPSAVSVFYNPHQPTRLKYVWPVDGILTGSTTSICYHLRSWMIYLSNFLDEAGWLLSEYSDYCLYLYYIHNVSPDASFYLLSVFHVELGSLHRTWLIWVTCKKCFWLKPKMQKKCFWLKNRTLQKCSNKNI